MGVPGFNISNKPLGTRYRNDVLETVRIFLGELIGVMAIRRPCPSISIHRGQNVYPAARPFLIKPGFLYPGRALAFQCILIKRMLICN